MYKRQDTDIVDIGILKPPEGEGYNFNVNPAFTYIDAIDISGYFAAGEPNIYSNIGKSSYLSSYPDLSQNVHVYPYMIYTFGVQLHRQVSNLTLRLTNIQRNVDAMYPFLTSIYINYIVQVKSEPFTSFENSAETIYYEDYNRILYRNNSYVWSNTYSDTVSHELDIALKGGWQHNGTNEWQGMYYLVLIYLTTEAVSYTHLRAHETQ